MKDKVKYHYRDLLLTVLLILMVYWYQPLNALLLAAGIFVLLGLLVFQIRYWNHVFWKTLTKLMQSVFQPIIGMLLFYCILTPIGLLSRVFKKKKKQEVSTFVAVEQDFDEAFFKKQW